MYTTTTFVSCFTETVIPNGLTGDLLYWYNYLINTTSEGFTLMGQNATDVQTLCNNYYIPYNYTVSA